ncbi:hypothetical protein F5B19DRAFT_483942 [Rostrohypoxylon terebratum]|nr:hypothetical protein F5B19DRAFT_483942 [Rostrohypoxylon terebratum]
MVSFWPWKGHDSSPSSFEKTLSTLSDKIAKTTANLDKARSNSRRIKILWTLYLTFAYLVYAIVLTLVVGWQNLGPWEFTGMAGGPVVIYLVRTFTNAYFSFRIDSLESRLKDHQAERAKTIQRLKDATKYDSTLELLEKYGGTGEKPNQPKKQGEGEDQGKGQQRKTSGTSNAGSVPPSARINIPPPPTANIQRPPLPHAPVLGAMPPRQDPSFMPRPRTPLDQQPTEEFAPNAGPLPTSYAQYEMSPGPPRWYDRIMDLMLGEDETASKNRIVLICKNCRLVNGQAPPGTKSLAELGTWRYEGKKIIREVLESKKSSVGLRSEDRDSDVSSDLVKIENDSEGTGNTDGETSNTEQRNLRHRNKKSQMVP